jgi:flagellar basal body-associated protein FliL
MSDDKEKDDKKAKAEPAEPAKAKGGSMGMIAAIGVLAAVGAGLVWLGMGMIGGAEAPAGGAKPADHGAAHGAGGEGGKDEKHESLLHAASALDLGELMTNISEQGGRRYVKLSCTVWVNQKHAKTLGMGGGGDGHGGAAPGPTSLIQLLKSTLEENIRSYSLDELTGRNSSQQLRKGFSDATTRRLRELFPELPAEDRLVHDVTITGLLVQ